MPHFQPSRQHSSVTFSRAFRLGQAGDLSLQLTTRGPRAVASRTNSCSRRRMRAVRAGSRAARSTAYMKRHVRSFFGETPRRPACATRVSGPQLGRARRGRARHGRARTHAATLLPTARVPPGVEPGQGPARETLWLQAKHLAAGSGPVRPAWRVAVPREQLPLACRKHSHSCSNVMLDGLPRALCTPSRNAYCIPPRPRCIAHHSGLRRPSGRVLRSSPDGERGEWARARRNLESVEVGWCECTRRRAPRRPAAGERRRRARPACPRREGRPPPRPTWAAGPTNAQASAPSPTGPA